MGVLAAVAGVCVFVPKAIGGGRACARVCEIHKGGRGEVGPIVGKPSAEEALVLRVAAMLHAVG